MWYAKKQTNSHTALASNCYYDFFFFYFARNIESERICKFRFSTKAKKKKTWIKINAICNWNSFYGRFKLGILRYEVGATCWGFRMKSEIEFRVKRQTVLGTWHRSRWWMLRGNWFHISLEGLVSFERCELLGWERWELKRRQIYEQ